MKTTSHFQNDHASEPPTIPPWREPGTYRKIVCHLKRMRFIHVWGGSWLQNKPVTEEKVCHLKRMFESSNSRSESATGFKKSWNLKWKSRWWQFDILDRKIIFHLKRMFQSWHLTMFEVVKDWTRTYAAATSRRCLKVLTMPYLYSRTTWHWNWQTTRMFESWGPDSVRHQDFTRAWDSNDYGSSPDTGIRNPDFTCRKRHVKGSRLYESLGLDKQSTDREEDGAKNDNAEYDNNNRRRVLAAVARRRCCGVTGMRRQSVPTSGKQNRKFYRLCVRHVVKHGVGSRVVIHHRNDVVWYVQAWSTCNETQKIIKRH